MRVDETGIVRPTAKQGARLRHAHAPAALTVSANLDASIISNSGDCVGQARGQLGRLQQGRSRSLEWFIRARVQIAVWGNSSLWWRSDGCGLNGLWRDLRELIGRHRGTGWRGRVFAVQPRDRSACRVRRTPRAPRGEWQPDTIQPARLSDLGKAPVVYLPTYLPVYSA